MNAAQSTYHADCVCGRAITSFTLETSCPDCGRHLVFEWGRDPIVMSSSLPEPVEPANPQPLTKGASA